MTILTASLAFALLFLFIFSAALWPVLFAGSDNRVRWFLAANVLNLFLVAGMYSEMKTQQAAVEKTRAELQVLDTEIKSAGEMK